MQRIAAHRYFPEVAEIIFPGITPHQAITKVLSVKTVYQFQMEWMYAFNERVIQDTMENFTYHISPQIKPKTGYLYISNHRDIILDSSLLQMVLVFNNLPTSMITYGDNLLVNQLAEDIARSNKMFKVVRQGNRRELFKNSLLLSEFIRTCIREGDSCWIAQRNGRTKDGSDKTSQALVKMMAMSGDRNDPVDNYAALNIVPVSVSYEYEPCDFLKTRELLFVSDGKNYEKEEGEDLNSMYTGVTQWKGKVHICLGDPITRDDLEPYRHGDFNTFAAGLSNLIDSRIYKGYKCFPTNFIACDLLRSEIDGGGVVGGSGERYSTQEKAAFLKRLEKIADPPLMLIEQSIEGFPRIDFKQLSAEEYTKARRIFLGIYANPVFNAMKAQETAPDL